MSEHKLKATKSADASAAETKTVDEKVTSERQKIAKGGFFLRGAEWILARFALTRNKYQNWTKARRIIVGWLCWLIVLPIIPIAAAIIWYVHDPEGFKKSPWAKALVGLAVLWAGYAGMVVTNQPVVDCNGKYSICQTAADGESAGDASSANTATDAAKSKIASQTVSKASNGRTFANCTDAFNAGVFNIKRSDGAYQSKLDRDSDGIACEK